MNLSAHFTLEELTHTEVRADNACPNELMQNLQDTADLMERVRSALSADAGRDIPINVHSAYRSEEVNTAVGGQKRSDHLLAEACDFTAPSYGTPYEIAQFLAKHVDDLGIGQVIHEFGRWVHVSTKTPEREVNRCITICKAGVEAGIQVVA